MHKAYHNTAVRYFWVSLMLLGFVAVLIAQAFVMPNRSGDNVIIDARFYDNVFNNKGNSVHADVFKNKNTHHLHLRLNKHFQSEKLFFVLPCVSQIKIRQHELPKPLYYYNNHFVSSFLYACIGRAPPTLS